MVRKIKRPGLNGSSRAIATYEANGGKKGYKLRGVPDDDWFKQVLEDGLRTPGVFNIPICTPGDARNNWFGVYDGGRKEGPNFPCDLE